VRSTCPVFIITWVVARLTFFLNPAHDMLDAVVVAVRIGQEELLALTVRYDETERGAGKAAKKI
jgi:hypothetical protein